MRPGDRFTVVARRALSNLALDSGFAYFAKRIKFNDAEVGFRPLISDLICVHSSFIIMYSIIRLTYLIG